MSTRIMRYARQWRMVFIQQLHSHFPGNTTPDRGSLWPGGTSPTQQGDGASLWDLEQHDNIMSKIIKIALLSIQNVVWHYLLLHVLLNLPSSPPDTEKSFLRIVHFCMRWALQVAAALTLLIPSWMVRYTSLSFPSMMSDTLAAWLPSCRQSSTASILSSSVGSMVSVLLQHWNT